MASGKTSTLTFRIEPGLKEALRTDQRAPSSLMLFCLKLHWMACRQTNARPRRETTQTNAHPRRETTRTTARPRLETTMPHRNH
jgi:hypothetical protein